MSLPASIPIRRSLDTEIQYLKGVGPKNAVALGKIGLKTVRDILFYLPRRYDDRRAIPPIRTLRPGQVATVRGRIIDVSGRASSRRGMVVIKAAVSDGTGTIALTWFNQPWIRRKLESYKGEILAYGKVQEKDWLLEINSPEFELLDEEDSGEAFATLAPVYPLSEGVPQGLVRKAAAAALDGYLGLVEDPMPAEILSSQGLVALKTALRGIHQPKDEESTARARRRLVFDEFFYMQVALARRRRETGQEPGIAFDVDRTRLDSDLAKMLPFELTGAQKRVIGEILSDMERPSPMNRLVQGDVGSGKTAVAAAAMLAAIRNGYQAALMVPTEILAEQHATNLRRLFEPIGIDVELLIGRLTAAQRQKGLARTASGQAHVVVGTHALIQEGVAFQSLGLAVIDEQHRFGVLQRAALRAKGLGNPDVLVMTATPIPRTLTMTVYGDLNISIIDELPPGRMAIKTHWRKVPERESVYGVVRKLIGEGRQAYFVCPLVAESEKMLAQAAEDLHYRLTSVFPDLRIGLLHGQLKGNAKDEAMEQFRRHELDILVSTTVIEVGVDVPNASIMVIEDANRFGLSQLHQLRGRVGRGSAQSYCILLGDAKTEDAEARMNAMVATADGFKIAEEDLRLRGPGAMMGTAQSGFGDFKIADLLRDGPLLEMARGAAIALVERDPELKDPAHAGILQRSAQGESVLAAVAIS